MIVKIILSCVSDGTSFKIDTDQKGFELLDKVAKKSEDAAYDYMCPTMTVIKNA